MPLICTVILAFGIICPAAIAQAAERTSYVPVTTAEEAVERALIYTGLDRLEGLDLKDRGEMACLTIARDSTTPFLSDSINGRRVWQVLFDNVVLDTESSSPEAAQKHPKTIHILIDSASGQLYEVLVLDIDTDRSEASRAPAFIAEEQLRGITHEEYLGFPGEPPAITLLAVFGMRWCSPLESKYMFANYVIYRSRDAEPRNVWVVHGHGFPPFRDGVDNMRTVIDARTGEGLFSVNLPFKSRWPKGSTEPKTDEPR